MLINYKANVLDSSKLNKPPKKTLTLNSQAVIYLLITQYALANLDSRYLARIARG